MGQSSDERDRRIQRDPGDPTDLVYYRPTRSARVYHETPACSALSSLTDSDQDPSPVSDSVGDSDQKEGSIELRESSRKQAQRRLKTPCSRCILDDFLPDDHGATTSDRIAYWRSRVDQLRESL